MTTGVVRNLQGGEQLLGAEQRGQVLGFRVEHTDPNGEVKGYSQVEMRGEVIYGGLADGDRIEVDLERARNGVFRVDRVRNVSTNSDVWISNRPGLKIAHVLIVLIMLGLFGAFVYFLMNMGPPF